jgi:CheY-like chemotaxis protein
VDLNELLDQCCTFVEADTAAKRLDLRYGFRSGAPEHFVTDANLLRQILLNLLSNAVKFTERGAVTIEVGGTIERITVEVSDSGCGVGTDQRHKLFRQGERLGAEKSEIPGHGNGLAMSQRLVQCMGGEIGYRENPAGGSIFWVGLPEGRLSEATEDQPAASMRAGQTLRVLLVEDVASHREIGRAFLLDGGHLVSEAESGAEAVRQAAKADFDVVLMNLGLPGMNGIEAIRQIRMIPGERGRVTIVGMTASVPDRQIVEGLRAGMTAYLVKPFTGGELLTLLDRVVRRRPVALLSSQATFEPNTLAQLASCMSFSEMEGQLLGLARTLEVLIDALKGSETHTAPTAELVHEVAVTAGRYGFAALSVAAHAFDAAIAAGSATAGPVADALSATARAALDELHELVSAEPVGAP